MKITVKKLTDVDLLRAACESTMQAGQTSNMTLDKMYRCEHSPIRTQLFWVEMEGIPTFVSVHFVRHKIGTEHFVRSNREDRGGDKEATRLSPVKHSMLINAQSLITMARKRLCYQAHKETREIMKAIRCVIGGLDPDLERYMVPECVYRGARCPELRPCGKYKVERYSPGGIFQAMMVRAEDKS
jgi:hypothetical protein